MARVTVEDCVLQIPNRFELVMLSAHRARSLSSGAELRVGRDRDKNPVVALREIAEQKLALSDLEEALIKGLQKRIEPEQPEEEVTELMAGEQQGWVNAMETADDGADSDIDDGDESDDSLEEGSGDGVIDDFGKVSFEDADVSDIKD